jgi:hypothetical protein
MFMSAFSKDYDPADEGSTPTTARRNYGLVFTHRWGHSGPANAASSICRCREVHG